MLGNFFIFIMPRLLLITASSLEIRRVRQARVLNFQQITMPYLAARVPPHWEVFHVDEEVDVIDWDVPVDVVAITFHTPSAYHAYEIAERFRARQVCGIGRPARKPLSGRSRACMRMRSSSGKPKGCGKSS